MRAPKHEEGTRKNRMKYSASPHAPGAQHFSSDAFGNSIREEEEERKISSAICERVEDKTGPHTLSPAPWRESKLEKWAGVGRRGLEEEEGWRV